MINSRNVQDIDHLCIDSNTLGILKGDQKNLYASEGIEMFDIPVSELEDFFGVSVSLSTRILYAGYRFYREIQDNSQ